MFTSYGSLDPRPDTVNTVMPVLFRDSVLFLTPGSGSKMVYHPGSKSKSYESVVKKIVGLKILKEPQH